MLARTAARRQAVGFDTYSPALVGGTYLFVEAKQNARMQRMKMGG